MKKKFLLSLVILLALFTILGLNPFLQVTNYTYQSSEIPAAFDNFKICHISDLHCKSFGKDNKTLLNKIREMAPDIVVFTGDIVDESHTDLSSVEALLAGLQQMDIPGYYITGNHELEPGASEQYNTLLSYFTEYGVTHLDDNSILLKKGNDSISITGCKWYSKYLVNFLEPTIPEGFNILLYHGADFYDLVSDYNYDLVLTGHIHGGLIRIPLLDVGVFSNTGTLFPKYTAGIYQNTFGTSTMIVSRGLGDAVLPRFYNRPELVCITLKTAGESLR
ncbi:MAG: metallophosphoesterase [Lachnospiraceae bacterium]|nr:metallophosphoesterase [Lachnospiraceae bacterium]